MPEKSRYTLASLTLAALTLAACGGSGSSNSDDDSAGDGSQDNSVTTLTVDATAGGFGTPADDPANRYTYLNLNTAEVVDIDDAEADDSDAWHIAFKRTSIKLNGGISGPGSVGAVLLDEQSEFYAADGSPNASVFLNADPGGELSALTEATAAADLEFETDQRAAAIAGDGSEEGWWLYDRASHTVSANTDAWWLVRTAEGDGYAKFHVTAINQNAIDVAIAYQYQAPGTTSFTGTPRTATLTVPPEGGQTCFDFDTDASVDCTAAAGTWDIQLDIAERRWALWTNGGISGDGQAAAFGPVDDPQSYPSGTTDISGTDIAGHYNADAAGGVFDEQSWYAYNLQDQHRLWPNYRVYAIDTGGTTYKLQIVSYYDAAGTSGIYTLRYAPLE